MDGGRRTLYLDGLRGIAALQVVLHHTYLEIYPLEQGVAPTGLTKLATSSMMLSGLGVTVFVVLSGYSLSLAAHRHGWTLRGGTAPFLRRRARRLLPPYYIALAISLVLGLTVLAERTGTHWDVSVPFDGADVAAHLLLIPDIVGNPYSISHPLWSIAFMFQLYLLFPLLLLAAVRWGIRRVAIWALVVTTPIAVVTYQNANAMLLLRQLHFVGCFAAGMAALAIVRAGGVVTIRGRTRQPPWVAIAAALFCVWAVAPLNHLNHVPFALGVCCVLVALGTGGTVPLRRVLEWPGLVWVGVISYSLYLVHGPVVHGVWLAVLRPSGRPIGDIASLALLLPLAVGASLFVAWAFHRLVERPLTPVRGPAAVVPERPAAERVS